ncbi:hypothetical protein [Halocalculus aciditolerans]|uniref:Uncharacterized protein n=1 Tax=Halocalculus aciditolerans TaxID=1383812 RepID=A0A830FA89_9EURY|nr:hypothetical protein [Halocalculus aciditolerans]GGL55174.1 hypothetical protein GCM10009039_11610 [Halocalculus aciditolerans]
MSANPTTPNAPDYENDDVAQELRERRTSIEDERETELKENLSTKERLQQARRERKSFEMDVDGISLEFAPPGGMQSERLTEIGMEWMTLFDGLDEDLPESEEELDDVREQSEEVAEKVGEYGRELAEILADCSTDPDLDTAFWRETYTTAERIEMSQRLMAGGEDPMTAEEVEQFRSE